MQSENRIQTVLRWRVVPLLALFAGAAWLFHQSELFSGRGSARPKATLAETAELAEQPTKQVFRGGHEIDEAHSVAGTADENFVAQVEIEVSQVEFEALQGFLGSLLTGNDQPFSEIVPDVVTTLVATSRFRHLGIREGDTVRSVNDVPIVGMVGAPMGSILGGARLVVEVARNGRIHRIVVTQITGH